MSTSELTKIIFLDVSFPPLVIVQDHRWRHQIANNQVVKRFFSQCLIEAISRGEPMPADQALELLSHWVSFVNDREVIQHTFALRMKLDAYLYAYAIEQQRLDEFAWHSLGICSTGRQVALRLDDTLQLSLRADWYLYTLWDWISAGDPEHFRCHIGVLRQGFWVNLRYQDLAKNVFCFIVSGGHLWPPTFPVVDSDALSILTTRHGSSFSSALDALIA